MAQVKINTPAPPFSLADYNNEPVSLTQFKDEQNVLLVFNRGFF